MKRDAGSVMPAGIASARLKKRSASRLFAGGIFSFQ